MGGQNARNSERSGSGQVVGFSQGEGLSALGRGQYGWPECKEFRAFWERTEVVGFSQVEGLNALGRGQYGWPECKEFRAFGERTREARVREEGGGGRR